GKTESVYPVVIPSILFSLINFSIAGISDVLVMKYSSAICFAGDFSNGYQSVTAVVTPSSFAFLMISHEIFEPPKINNFLPFNVDNIFSPFSLIVLFINLSDTQGKSQFLY